MKPESKELLIKDLCGRLPYGVMVNVDGYDTEKLIGIENETITTKATPTSYSDKGEYPIDIVKPYLRSMSSMTEEEIIEFNNIPSTKNYTIIKDDLPWDVANYKQIDWLNAHHLDFRNLIERGFAIDCTNLNIYKNGRKDKNA